MTSDGADAYDKTIKLSKKSNIRFKTYSELKKSYNTYIDELKNILKKSERNK